MPLPVIKITGHKKELDAVLESSDEDESDNDVDGILAMLRSNQPNDKGANLSSLEPSKNVPGSISRQQTSTLGSHDSRISSSLEKKTDSNDDRERKTKFGPVTSDEIGGKNLDRSSLSSTEYDVFKQSSHQGQTDMRKLVRSEPSNEGAEAFKFSKSKENASADSIKTLPSRPDKTTNQARFQATLPDKDEHRQLISEYGGQPYDVVIHRISESQNDIKDICKGIQQLQLASTVSCTKNEGTFKSIEILADGVTKSFHQLEELTKNLKIMMEEMESRGNGNAIDLQRFAENEKQIFIEQITDEKSRLSDRWATIEKDVALLREQKKDMELEKREIFAEKERILKERTQLQQDEALFEQRKLAANEEIQYAESALAKMHQMDIKVKSEMVKLVELNDFVCKKDAEAYEKLAKAQALNHQSQEQESKLKCEADIVDRQKQEVFQERSRLVDERVSLLKEKSKCRELRGGTNTRDYAHAVQFRNDVGADVKMVFDYLAAPENLSTRLTALKKKLNKLREE